LQIFEPDKQFPDVNRKIRVLFLPKWYPHKYDPMPGLFVQRQAESLTPHCDVAVIYVHPDPDCPNKYEAEFSEENEVRVLRVYYRVKKHAPAIMAKALSLWRFYRANMKAVESIRQFSPDLVHAHVLTRMGFIAWRVCRKQHIPLVISEHWSRYFPENNSYGGWMRKRVTSFIVKKASAVIAVSEQLKLAMKKFHLDNPNFLIIPNVVDTRIFTPVPSFPENPLKTIIHISCFDDRSKNISGFLDAISELSLKRNDFRCLLVGDGPDLNSVKVYSQNLGIIDNYVFFTGLKEGVELAQIFNQADFSVVSSHYETFGTVVVESLACGIPVVSTRVGVAPDVIGEKNGLLIDPGNKNAMVDAIDWMLDHCRTYDKTAVCESISEKFNKKTIGNQLVGLYRTVIGPMG
jgi:glycosyltransferase involved in cell wall biosynthesis